MHIVLGSMHPIKRHGVIVIVVCMHELFSQKWLHAVEVPLRPPFMAQRRRREPRVYGFKILKLAIDIYHTNMNNQDWHR